jgi:hypothetical protein
MAEAIKSEWGQLSKHLIASFWEVKRDGSSVNDISLQAPLLDANFEASFNWISPFERIGEDFLPTAQQLATSGLIDKQLKDYSRTAGFDLAQLEGKTSITKLNSTQIFNGMPPVKFPVTLLFRAWKNPKKEVESPFNQLMKWALPVKLEGDTTLLSRGTQVIRDERSLISALLPSASPTFVAMKYKNRTYKPLVIESISAPLSAPVDRDGDFVELSVQVQLATLTAIDRGDWSAMSR